MISREGSHIFDCAKLCNQTMLNEPQEVKVMQTDKGKQKEFLCCQPVASKSQKCLIKITTMCRFCKFFAGFYRCFRWLQVKSKTKSRTCAGSAVWISYWRHYNTTNVYTIHLNPSWKDFYLADKRVRTKCMMMHDVDKRHHMGRLEIAVWDEWINVLCGG